MAFHVRSVSSLVPRQRNILGAQCDVAVGLTAPMLGMAQAAQVCDGRLFLPQDSPTGLNIVSTASNPMIYTPVGAVSGLTYNALGYPRWMASSMPCVRTAVM